MHRCGSSFFGDRHRSCLASISIFVMASLTIHAFTPFALAQVPLEGQSGVIEKSLRQSLPQELPPEPKAPQITNENKPLPKKDPVADATFFIKKIKLTGNSVISNEKLVTLIDLGEGKEVTMSLLNAIADEVTAVYAAEGYFLARVFVPNQEVKDATVEMVISEGRVNKILVQGNKTLSTEKLKERMKRVQDEPALKEQTLEHVLLELNELMGVKVRAVLKPGDLPGTSDLVMDVTESRPYTFSFDSDNFGSRYTGPTRFGLNMSYANIFTLGDQFSARWSRSEYGQDLYTPFYTVPINSYGTRMKVSYTFLENEIKDSLEYLAAGGSLNSVGLELSHLMHKSQTASFSVRTGLDLKSFENEAQGTNTTKDNLMNVSLGFEGNLSDSFLGRTFYDLNFEMGLREGDSSRGLVSRAGGHGKIFTTNINVTRLQSAKILNSYFILKFQGQMNNTRALSSYLMGIGGMGTVRGYPLSAYQGDKGYNLSAEYTVPLPMEVPWYTGFPNTSTVFSAVSFLDHGKIFVRDNRAGEVDQKITTAGGGLKMSVSESKKEGKSPAVSFAVTYGAPVFNSIIPEDSSYGTVYLNGMIDY
jgi:hemolysin activation/secretion protein